MTLTAICSRMVPLPAPDVDWDTVGQVVGTVAVVAVVVVACYFFGPFGLIFA